MVSFGVKTHKNRLMLPPNRRKLCLRKSQRKMAAMYESFTDIIENWPGGIGGFCKDAGVTRRRAYVWRERNTIPARFWTALVRGAANRGFSVVTLELLAGIAARKPVNTSSDNFA